MHSFESVEVSRSRKVNELGCEEGWLEQPMVSEVAVRRSRGDPDDEYEYNAAVSTSI